tara:strand:- start:40 stop:453 length:414 start_codon:yes stop_codon:yes gene_type:complete
MRILGLPALYLVYKGLTRGVSPVIIQPDEPPTKLGLFAETEEFKQQQKEAEDARRKAEEESIRKQKALQEEKEYEEFRKQTLEELKWQAEQEAIRQTPQTNGRQLECKYGWQPVLKGNGTRNNPYYWVCEKIGRLGF